MPWSIENRSGEFCVIKDSDGEVEGCHGSRSDAIAQIAALNASENKSANYIKENGLGLPTSFPELEEMMRVENIRRKTVGMLQDLSFLMSNVFDDDISEDSFDVLRALLTDATARVNEFQGEFKQLGLNSATDKGISKEDIAWAEKEIEKIEDDHNKDNSIVITPHDETSGVYIYKDAIGTYRWLARYSNNIRDEDNPAEIISAKSHERFDRLVKAGIVDPPELWVWHEQDWSIGKAEWVAIDYQDGHTFTVAGGYFYPQFQHVAKELSAQAHDMRVSHGMPKWSVKRDSKDRTIITEHITKEISLLPAWAAANPFTGFVTIKEHDDMAFSQADKARLMEKHGVSEALLDEVVSLNTMDSSKAKSEDLETKEVNEEIQETETQEVETEVAEESVDEGTTEAEEPVVPELPVDVAQTLEAIMKSVMVVNERLEKGLSDLNDKVASLEQGEETRVAEKAATSPLASLTSMMVGSIIGNEEARVDGRTALAKSKPAETKSSAGVESTGIPFVDNFLTSGQ